MKTLNVKNTTRDELTKKWGFPLPYCMKEPLYIRCNKRGEVNWDVAPVYTETELSERNNVNIIETALEAL